MRIFLIFVMVFGLVACGGGRQQAQTGVQKTGPAPQVIAGNPKFADSDPVDWPSIKPWRYAVHGVDVSRYQNQIDWGKLRQGRVSFAYVKATEGADHIDPAFRDNWRAAAQAGMPRGAYHFYYFCRTAKEQVDWFIRQVPREARSLPPVLDIEWNHQSPTCRSRPSPAIVRAEMQRFLSRAARHYDKTPMIYTTVDFYHQNELWRIRGYPFWLRSVADHPRVTYPGRPWTFWQYTGTGRVPGIAGNTDLNVFRGSASEWQAWLGRNGG